MNLLEWVNNTIFILVTEKWVPFVGDITFGIYDWEWEVIFQKDMYAEKWVIKLSIPPMHENDYYFSLETDEGYTDLKEVKIMKSLKWQDKTRKYKVDIDNERDNEIKNTEDLLNAFYIENGNRIKSIEDSVLDAETRRELQKKELVWMIKWVEKKVIDTHTKINTSHFNLWEKIEKEIEGVSSIIQDVVQDTNKSITLLSQKIDKGNEESGLLLSKKIKELKEKIPNSPILKYEVDDSKIDENTLWTSQKINKEVKGMKKRVVEAVNYGGGWASYFIDLLDAPTTYVGQAAKVVKVNATEDGLEFWVGWGGTVWPGTMNEIAYFDSANTVASLSIATYPSPTELSYVKGVTSSIQAQLNAFVNGMIYKGNWDASAWTFPWASVAQTGWFYTVSVAGTVDSVVFNVGDRLIAITNNASTTTYAWNWTQLDATDAVTSVFGRTGNVVATAGDYTAAQITNTPAGSIAAVNVQAAIDELATEKANASWALTQFVGNTAWRVFYSDGSGDITELALWASGTYLKSNWASSAPSFATPTGTGDVSKVGTPVNNQLWVWTGDGTLEGTADVTYDSSTKAMTFNQILDGATFAVYTANTAENSYSYLEFSDTEAAIDTPAFSLITWASLFSLNQWWTDAIFNVSWIASTNKTFTFPNATGTVSLIANTETLTNKRVTKRITTITSSGTPTINTDNCDCVTITALAEAITSMTTNLSGTPSNFDSLVIRIKDNGTARAITWGASFEAKGVALPTTTVLSKVLTVGFIYDTVTSKWWCVASAQEA